MSPLARIIDANANRAREALRVMEDAARFALNNPALSSTLKHLRHDLQAAMDLLPLNRLDLLASRDTPSDVGTTIKTDSELSRTDLPAITAAAASRLTEALRSLEEASKVLASVSPVPPNSPRSTSEIEDPTWRGRCLQGATRFEHLRYRAYTADKDLSLALSRSPRQWRLCVLLSESLCTHHPWLKVAELAIQGGADCLQLREKSLSDRELLHRAKSLVALAHPLNVSVVINDRPDIALLSSADAVHLGQTDLSINDVRSLGGPPLRGGSLLIGVSTENLDQAHAAASSGADYIALGPMFPTTTKEKPRIAGPTYLRSYLADETLSPIPHLAIGGITPTTAPTLAAARCQGIAVSSYVCASQDPAAACADLLSSLRPL